MESKTLIFIHVPKTAGTSFYDLIEKNYDKKKRFVFNINKGKNPIPKLLRQQRKTVPEIIYGHGTFGLHEIFPRAKYLTFIRNPVSHTISNYHYIRTSPHNRLHRQVSRMSFREFVLHMKDMHHDNQHYRQLTNTLFRIENPAFYQRELVPDYKFLDYALDKIDYIYRFEEIDMAIPRIAAEFNWSVSEMSHLNISRKKEIEVSTEDIDIIKTVNYLDWYIYESSLQLSPQCSSTFH